MRTEVMAGQYLDLLGQAAGDAAPSRARCGWPSTRAAKYTVERPLQLGAALAAARPELPATQLTKLLKRILDGCACSAYGLPLGVAFQLRDDMLGVFGDPVQTGKPVTMTCARESGPCSWPSR